MSFDTYWRFLLALLFVVALIAGCAWVARRFGFAGRFGAPGGKRRLAIVEVLPLDGRRRLVLLRRDDVEHLVLLGIAQRPRHRARRAGDFSGLIEDAAVHERRLCRARRLSPVALLCSRPHRRWRSR